MDGREAAVLINWLQITGSQGHVGPPTYAQGARDG